MCTNNHTVMNLTSDTSYWLAVYGFLPFNTRQ